MPTEHRDDGLDLARLLTRAAVRAGGRPPRRRPQRPAPQQPAGVPHDPELLGDTLRRFVDDHGWDLDLRVQQVFGRWPQIVGAEVGAHCVPEHLADGKLVVRTDSTAWATQLRLLAPVLLRRIGDELGPAVVTDLDIVGPRAPSWTRGRLKVRGRGPRDTYG